MKRIIKKVSGAFLALSLVIALSFSAFANSQSLNSGGAKWTGGENSSGILYSRVYDMAVDGVKYSATVWTKTDTGILTSKTGTTTGTGYANSVHVSHASTHKNPFVAEKAGYKNFTCISTN